MATLPYSLYNISDSAIGELSTAVTGSVTTLALKSGQGVKFPASDFCARVENEWVYCSTRTADTLNGVTRGYDGTTATTHAANVTIFQAASKALFQRIYANLQDHTHSGGSDPWTVIALNADVSTSTATAVNVSNLAFTPVSSTRYEFRAMLLLRTASTTINPRVGLAWPTGMTDGVAQIMESQAATGTPLFASGNVNTALLVAVGGLPNSTQSWPASISGVVVAGSSPSGNVRVQLASETAGTAVTVKSGSTLRYRTY